MMPIHALRTLIIAAALVPLLAHCDKGNGNDHPEDTGTDTPGDVITDSTDDTPPDAPGDTTPDTVTTWSTCAKQCSVTDDCCLTGTTADCGTYPNKWTCDAVCMTAGCDSDAECVTWATGLSLPGADAYKCATAHLYYTAAYCVPGCTTADDCCPSGTDCSAYPQRRVCDDGACKLDGCIDNTECVAWATGLGLTDAASFVCETFGYSDTAACAKPCSSVTDCCPSGSCGTFPNHADCLAGHCLTTCTDDGECRDWAVSNGYPDPADYVCHAF
jgi:hypothetical protein